jgi:SAM-dependent methyltransferase
LPSRNDAVRSCIGAIAGRGSPCERLSLEDDRLFDDDALQAARIEYDARHERPAIRALAGDVRGLDVLDVGCAGGEHSLWLLEHAARVVALEANPKMYEIARRRLAPEVEVRLHDLREPLPLSKESFDLVFSSLTLHYARDWEPLLREFHRVTRPGGALVFSTHHPCRGLHEGLGVDYFSTGLVVDRWMSEGGDAVRVRYWRRPLQSIVGAVVETGWRIARVVEPRIAEAVDPWFLIVKATR